MRVRYVCIGLIVLVFLVEPVWADWESLNWAIRPFEFLDFSQTYDRYSVLVDLLIYVLVFVGVAQVGLGSRFPGRAGSAISAGVGLSLAVAMVLAEERYGFNLQSFGPLAAGILVLLYGLMIYRLLRYAGAARLRSAALAYILLFLAFLAVCPGFFKWLDKKIPFLGVIAFLLLLFSLWGAVNPAHATAVNRRVFNTQIHKVRANEPMRRWARNAEQNETRFVKHYTKPEAKQLIQDSDLVLNDLNLVRKAIRRYGQNPETRQTILEQMRRLVPKGKELENDLRKLRELNERVLRLDGSLFSEKRRELLQQMSEVERNLLKKELRDETEKMGLDKKLEEIAAEIERRNQVVYQNLGEAAEYLAARNISEAVEAMNKAIFLEGKIYGLAKQIKWLEGKILKLTKRDVRVEKKREAA